VSGAEYKLHGVTVERETLDKETRRTIRHEPRAQLRLWVGKNDRPVVMPLDVPALLQLNQQVAAALAAVVGEQK
jgi:hypothetical protein